MRQNHFIFVKKKSMREKEFSFSFIKLSWKRFFMKEFKCKIFTNRNFADFVIKTQCIQRSNSYLIKTNVVGGRLLTVHNYAFKFSFSPFHFFRLNWVGCLFHCNTDTLRKQSFLYHDQSVPPQINPPQGVDPPAKFSKRGGFDRTSTLRGGLLEKRG